MTDAERIAELEAWAGVDRALYALRLHERLTDDDPELATVMYSMRGAVGPWFDMATGHPDWCWEIVDALNAQEARKQEEARRG